MVTAALVQSKSANVASASTASVTFDSSVTAGNLIAVIVRRITSGGDLASTVSVTVADDQSNSYTLVDRTAAFGSDDSGVLIFYAKNVAAGSTTVTATLNSASGKAEIAVWEVSGCDTTAPLETSNKATGNSSTPSAGNVTVAGGAFLLAGAQSTAGYKTFGNGTGWTGAAGASIWAASYFERRVVTAGTYTADFTSTATDTWGAVVAAFKEAAGGGPVSAALSGSAATPGSGTQSPVFSIGL